MISYFTNVQVNESFNRELLITMFLDWLSTSKNKINHLNYHVQTSFEYQEERKCLKIEDFKEYNIFGIQFSTSDNYKKARFVVEILYNYENQTLDLGFYKELNEDSKYISAISLPKIFVQLLQSEYILSDNHLKILDQPYFLSNREYKQLMNKHHELPIIKLTRNKKSIVNPFILSKKLFGIGHVICVRTNDKPTMDINYPNKDIERIDEQTESKMIAICYEKVLNFSIQEHTQNYMFDELINSRLQNKHSSNEELENFYVTEVNETQLEVDEYEELYRQTQDEYEELLKRKEELEKYLESTNNEVILTMSNNDQIKKELLLEIIKKHYQTVHDKIKYRKNHVLESILKENKS